MIKQSFNETILNPITLCSKCLHHEINSWVNENWKNIEPKVKMQIREELKGIKLKPGTCVVCNHNSVADKTTERIMEILEQKEYKIPKKLREDFKKFFL